jgi:integrase
VATINKRGRSWQLTWSDAEGQHRISLGAVSRQEAEIRRREKDLERLTGRKLTPSGVTFATFAAEYLGWYSGHWPSTYSRTESIFRLSLTPFFGDMALDHITQRDHTLWIAKRRGDTPTPSPATITKEARALAAAMSKAVKWRVITSNPLADVEAPPERHSKAPEYYDREQLLALYEASPFHADIWRFMVNTGLRRNEALFLKVKDIGADAIRVQSLEDRPTKSRKWRSVPLNDAARHAIDALAPGEREYLLPRIAPRSLTRAFENCARRAKLPGTLHWLRHSFTSHMVMAGADLPTVQKVCGHASITTTMRYAHLSQAHAQAAVQKISL